MKLTTILLPALYTFVALFTLSCSESNHDHDHDDHGEEHEHGDHDADEDDDHKGHDDDKDHAHGEGDHDHGHEHAEAIPGPNGGRVMTGVEPHLEFLVTEDRKVRITAVDDDTKPIALSGQTVSAMAGDRADPTRLAFAKDGEGLLSEGTLPEGKEFPIVVTIRTGPDASPVREKFNVTLVDCPTCDFKEYACICEHAHEEDDHK